MKQQAAFYSNTHLRYVRLHLAIATGIANQLVFVCVCATMGTS